MFRSANEASPYTPIRKDKPRLTHFPKEIGSTLHRAIGEAILTHLSGKISQKLTHFPKEIRVRLSYSKTV